MQGKLQLLTVESVGESQRTCTSFAYFSLHLLKLQSWPNKNNLAVQQPPNLGFSQGRFRLTDRAPIGMFPVTTVSTRPVSASPPAGRTIITFRFFERGTSHKHRRNCTAGCCLQLSYRMVIVSLADTGIAGILYLAAELNRSALVFQLPLKKPNTGCALPASESPLISQIDLTCSR